MVAPNGSEFPLARFVEAQASVYVVALQELRAGEKRSHWMWFVFPQLVGLGSSPTAQVYGIQGAREARAYLRHEVLGQRLIECTQMALSVPDRTASQIFGFPDDLKFCSSMTLFEAAAGQDGEEREVFAMALERFYGGVRDERTLELLP